MLPTLCWSMLAGWSCFVLAVESTHTVYKKEGDDVVLQPIGSFTQPITSIVWKDGLNIAIQWDETDTEVTYFRHFKEHCTLNTSSGEVTITGLTRDYSGAYTPQINDAQATTLNLRVISPVPVPTVHIYCVEKTSCILTCEGNITGVEEVTYKWRLDDTELPTSTKEYRVQKESSLNVTQFRCELKNPVSQESSNPISNPFTHSPEHLNINSGVTVFICLLTLILLLILIHRWKTGVWFFDQESLPWQADFWRRHAKPRRNDAVSNGIKAHQEQEQDEETAMT